MTELKLKPTILSEDPIEGGIVLTLRVDEDITYFQGHFSTYPLLPGVTQIDWAYHYGTTRLNTPAVFKGMEVIKFFKPITPDSTVELTLKWNAEKQKLAFIFQSSEGKHSSGRIQLAEEI
jgi:3-hydroxymyristoyl/3-hydroxydecanoyl-(acyl carrier protein) dehydratase